MEEPMDFFEWGKSTGAEVAVRSLVDDDPETAERIVALAESVEAAEVEPFVKSVFAAYHAYIVAFMGARKKVARGR